MIDLASQFGAGNDGDIFCQIVSVPVFEQGNRLGLGYNDGVGVFLDALERLFRSGKWRRIGHMLVNLFVKLNAPCMGLGEKRAAGAVDFGFERGIAEGLAGIAINPQIHRIGQGGVVACLRPIVEQFKGLAEAEKTVETPIGRVEIGKFRGRAHLRLDGLQFPVPDNGGMEKILLLGFHGVEHAAVGVDTNKCVLAGQEINQVFFGKCSHKIGFQCLETVGWGNSAGQASSLKRAYF